MFEYTGNIHIHSSYSDGSASIPEIAGYGKQAGLDFLIITDHNQLTGLSRGEEGYNDGLMVLIGTEINYEKNHYLALNVSRPIPANDHHPQTVIDEVNEQGGIGIIAHPFERGSALVGYGKTYCWEDWSVKDFQGIEIWNYLSQWRDGITCILKGIYCLLYPHYSVKGANREALAKMDYYQLQGDKVIAFGGSDAHGIKIGIGPWVFFNVSSYPFCFRCINTHILMDEKLNGDVNRDKKMLYNALLSGRSWVSDDYYKKSNGFQFMISSGNESVYSGDSINLMSDTKATVYTPYFAKVHLIKNGQLFAVSNGKDHCFKDLSQGIYRVEADIRIRFRYHPWVFTNSIWVRL